MIQMMTQDGCRCLCAVFNGTNPCQSACDTCARISGTTDKPLLPSENLEVLLMEIDGSVRVGKWTGSRWVIHADGLNKNLHSVIGWMPLPDRILFNKV